MNASAAAAAALAVAAMLGSSAAVSPPSGVKRTDLLRQDLSASGWEVVQVLVEFPPGATFPRHNHPGEEVVHMVEGLLEYRLDGGPPVTLQAGESLFIPAGTVHAVSNVGPGRGAELATYIVEKGKKLLVPVE